MPFAKIALMTILFFIAAVLSVFFLLTPDFRRKTRLTILSFIGYLWQMITQALKGKICCRDCPYRRRKTAVCQILGNFSTARQPSVPTDGRNLRFAVAGWAKANNLPPYGLFTNPFLLF